MAPNNEIPLSAVVAFGPRSLLATGTVAGSIDSNFSTSSSLEVFSLEFGRGKGLIPAGQPVTASESFHRLVWGTFNAEGAFPDGILAGGLADGSIALWDPSKIVQGQGSASLIAQLQAHKGAVKALEFNRLSPNLLASGGADGELKIWDISDPKSPTPYPAVAVAAAPGGSPGITHLAWNAWSNPKVAHILATCTETGVVKVWDMKKRSLVMELADNQGRMKRCSVVAWHPVISTQLVVGCADDLSPLLQIWDLRKNTMPIRELLGHEKGVVSASWCTQDPGMLLSSGKDGRTILWDVSMQQNLPLGQPLGEFSAGFGEYVHDLAWSPSNPGVFAAASLGGGENHSGVVRIQTLAAFTEPRLQQHYSEDGFSGAGTATSAAPPLTRAPVWLKRPAAATFGFGGRLVSVTNTKRQDGSIMATLSLRQVVTEENLAERSDEFEQAISSSERAALANFCASKAASAAKDEAEVWAFMQVQFQDDPKRQLLAHLGFEDVLPKPEGDSVDASLAAAAESLQLTSPRDGAAGTSPPRNLPDANGNSAFGDEDAGESFFENLPEVEAAPAQQPSRTTTLSPRPTTAGEDHGEAGESEAEIQRALFVSNYAAALDICLQADRMADALLIASIGGGDLWAHAQREYIRRAPRPYMKIVSAIMDHDLTGLVKSRPLDKWRETLAMLAAYADSGEFCALCDMLAKRLNGAGLHQAATLTWICAANVDKAVKQWTADLRKAPKDASVEELQSLMERAVVLGFSANQSEASPALASLVNEYASLLASQGRMKAALEYLNLIPGEPTTDVAVLRDRIYRSGAPGVSDAAAPPPFPFINDDVKVDAAAALQASTAQHAQHAQAMTSGPTSAPTTDFYARNKYTVDGGYRPPAANNAYTSGSGYNPPAPAYNNQQAGFSSSYGSYGGSGQQQQQQPSYQAPPQPTPHFVPQQTPQFTPQTMQPGAGSYGAQTGAYNQPSYNQVPAQPQPAWTPQQAPVATPKPVPPQAPTAAWVPQQPQAQQPPPQPQPAWQPSAQPAQQAEYPPQGPNVFRPASANTSNNLAPVNTHPAPVPAFVPHRSPVPTPTANYAPTHFGGSGPATPPQPAQPPPPPVPTGPPANVNISNVDTSKVSNEMKPVVAALRGLVQEVAAAQGPPKKRESEDNSRRIGVLFWRINAGDVSPGVQGQLQQLAGALSAGDIATAQSIQLGLTTTDWDECQHWMTALKRLLKVKSTMR